MAGSLRPGRVQDRRTASPIGIKAQKGAEKHGDLESCPKANFTPRRTSASEEASSVHSVSRCASGAERDCSELPPKGFSPNSRPPSPCRRMCIMCSSPFWASDSPHRIPLMRPSPSPPLLRGLVNFYIDNFRTSAPLHRRRPRYLHRSQSEKSQDGRGGHYRRSRCSVLTEAHVLLCF